MDADQAAIHLYAGEVRRELKILDGEPPGLPWLEFWRAG